MPEVCAASCPDKTGLKFLFILFCTALFFFTADAQLVSLDISSGWQFRKTGDTKWMNATVPGTVHTDLLSNNKIPDPFFGSNEKLIQWIDTCDWEYETWFDAGDEVLQNKHCELVFEGLDTYAKVYLNDSLILFADNMFRTWKIDCKKYLKPGKNHLLIRFESALNKGKTEAGKSSYTLPGEEKGFTRKAQFHYGWDWGPRFVTCGIWRPVKLIAWNSFRLSDVHIVADELSDSIARLTAAINISLENSVTINFSVIVEHEKTDSFSFARKVSPGEVINLPFEIRNPKQWWSNGFGKPSLYKISITISDWSSFSQVKKISVGLRTVELVQQEDAAGKSFYFKLNGVPVFMKGANWIPADHFLPRVTKEKYRQLLTDAKHANINMLRVWGGGVYEDDAFYDLCDSLGILVWQDFMFACAMYPGDSSFIENVRQEVKDNVVRLRNHPCIALWCGNNEVDEGWKNWGWQKQYHYTQKDSSEIWNNYLRLFRHTIPGELSLLDPVRPWWESSPSIGWGHAASLRQGDSHYWGVWWGMEPFEVYKEKTGRFMSEYGFQGMPSMQAIKSFTTESERSMESSSIKNHQKHPTGFKTIESYMNDWYRKPKDFESYRYVSQLLQAEGMRIAIESHRMAKPFCMGTLFWQLNDTWPVTSWSSIDYTGQWKALHYTAEEVFEKYMITIDDTGKIFSVYVVSDDTVFTKGMLLLSVTDFSGNVLWRDSAVTYLSHEHANVVYKSTAENLIRSGNPLRTFLKMELRINSSIVAARIYYFNKPKDLLLDKPEIQHTFSRENDTIFIHLSSKTLAKNVLLELKDVPVHFSDNYFDLLPGESKTIMFQSKLLVTEIERRLVISSLSDSW